MFWIVWAILILLTPGFNAEFLSFTLATCVAATLEDSIRNAVRSAAKGLGLLARESTSWEEQKLSMGEGTSP